MSYSRWSYSYWYTYPTDGGDGSTVFCINCNWYYRANQLDTENKRELALIETRERCKDEYKPERQPTEGDMEELRVYMRQFVEDVKRGKWDELD